MLGVVLNCSSIPFPQNAPLHPLAYYAPSAAGLRKGVLLISLADSSVCSSVRGGSRRVCRSLHLGFGLLLRFLVCTLVTVLVAAKGGGIVRFLLEKCLEQPAGTSLFMLEGCLAGHFLPQARHRCNRPEIRRGPVNKRHGSWTAPPP